MYTSWFEYSCLWNVCDHVLTYSVHTLHIVLCTLLTRFGGGGGGGRGLPKVGVAPKIFARTSINPGSATALVGVNS